MPGTGELWLGVSQIAKETVAGTPLAATRKVYYRDPSFELVQAPRIQEFATGTREQIRRVTKGPKETSGQAIIPLSADEIIEWFLMGIKGAVVPVLANGVQTWTFKPGTALESATIEWHDGVQVWQVAGNRVDTLKIAGSVLGENLVTANFFAQDMVVIANITAALSDRVPSVIEGWETSLYIDPLGTAPGTTVQNGMLINWEVNIHNNLGRKFIAKNSKAASRIPFGTFSVDAKFMFEASDPATITEFNNWNSDTNRTVRLEFGQNEVIATTYKKFVKLDIPGAWTVVNLSGNDAETRTYEFSMQALYDPTSLASSFQAIAANARAAAWV